MPPANPPDHDAKLLDELAQVFADAALERLLAEAQKAESKIDQPPGVHKDGRQ